MYYSGWIGIEASCIQHSEDSFGKRDDTVDGGVLDDRQTLVCRLQAIYRVVKVLLKRQIFLLKDEALATETTGNFRNN